MGWGRSLAQCTLLWQMGNYKIHPSKRIYRYPVNSIILHCSSLWRRKSIPLMNYRREASFIIEEEAMEIADNKMEVTPSKRNDPYLPPSPLSASRTLSSDRPTEKPLPTRNVEEKYLKGIKERNGRIIQLSRPRMGKGETTGLTMCSYRRGSRSIINPTQSALLLRAC